MMVFITYLDLFFMSKVFKKKSLWQTKTIYTIFCNLSHEETKSNFYLLNLVLDLVLCLVLSHDH